MVFHIPMTAITMSIAAVRPTHTHAPPALTRRMSPLVVATYTDRGRPGPLSTVGDPNRKPDTVVVHRGVAHPGTEVLQATRPPLCRATITIPSACGHGAHVAGKGRRGVQVAEKILHTHALAHAQEVTKSMRGPQHGHAQPTSTYTRTLAQRACTTGIHTHTNLRPSVPTGRRNRTQTHTHGSHSQQPCNAQHPSNHHAQ